jgi:hypothetical protein
MVEKKEIEKIDYSKPIFKYMYDIQAMDQKNIEMLLYYFNEKDIQVILIPGDVFNIDIIYHPNPLGIEMSKWRKMLKELKSFKNFEDIKTIITNYIREDILNEIIEEDV